MVFRVAVAAVLLLGIYGASPVSAAPTCDPGPSQADIEACKPEVFKHCDEFVPNADAITKCLMQKVKIISAACRAVMTRPPPKIKLPPCGTARRD